MTGLLTICAIFQYFGTHKKELRRGENHLESGHVEEYQYNETEGYISGMVHSSWKRVSYKTKVYLNDKHKITSTSCECVEREDACSHAACLALWVNRNISCTDITCSWKKKKRQADEMTQTIEDLYPGKQHKSLKRTTAEIDDDKAQLYKQLVDLKRFSGSMWLLSPEEDDEVLPVRTVDELLKCTDATSITDLDERATRILELMIVSPDHIASVAKLTGDQRNSTAWQKLRCYRLTSSRFGDVLTRKKAWSSKAIHNIAYPADISKVRAIQHGVQNEEAAFKIVQNILGDSKLTHTGLHLNKEGTLGASPDGLVGDDAVLEIKCPLSAIPFENVTRAVELGKLPFLGFDENKQLFLKANCKYYHQVQGQMYLTDRTKCYFAVYVPRKSEHELLLLTVDRDDQWKSNLDILNDFYKTKMLPYIVSKRD